MSIIPQELAWYVVGPLIGIVVVGMYAIMNKPIGASGSYAQITDKILGKVMKEPWRLFFMGGVIIGGMLAAWLSGHLTFTLSYGTLGKKIPHTDLFVLLFLGGILMGYGARWMGGCTSGHGLCGTAIRSAGSYVATATFFVTAVAVTFLIHIITGGFI